MRAVQLIEPGMLAITDVTIPAVGSDEVLLGRIGRRSGSQRSGHCGERLAPSATGTPDRCARTIKGQLDLGADGVILHGASPH